MNRYVKNTILAIIISIFSTLLWLLFSFGTNTYVASVTTICIPLSMYWIIKTFNKVWVEGYAKIIKILTMINVVFISVIFLPLILTSVKISDMELSRLGSVYKIFYKEIIIGTLLSIGFSIVGIFITQIKAKSLKRVDS